MKRFILSTLFLSFGLFLSLQLSAQCSNINNKNGVRADNHVFGPNSFGQSIVADVECLGGNEFREFSFWSQGNSPTRFDLRIYQGQTVSGTPMYTQKAISNPPTNFGGKLTVKLEGGTGSLRFRNGETYTFKISMTGGNLIAHVSGDATPGQAYLKTGFDSGKDLRYEIKARSDISIVAAEYGIPGGTVRNVKPVLQAMANDGIQSFEVRNQQLLYDHGLTDPAPGRQKTLKVTYRKAGRSYSKTFQEKDTFSF